MAFRSEGDGDALVGELRAEAQVSILELHPFDGLDATDFVRARFGVEPSVEATRLLLDRSAGNPRAMDGLARALAEVVRPDELTGGRYSGLEIRLRDLPALDKLGRGPWAEFDTNDLDVACAAAMLGSAANADRIVGVLNREPDEILRSIGRLRDAGVFVDGGTLRFASPTYSERARGLETAERVGFRRAVANLLYAEGGRHAIAGARLLASGPEILDEESCCIVAECAGLAWNSQEWEASAWLWETLAERGEGTDREHARHLTNAATAFYRSLDLDGCRRTATAAIRLASGVGDSATWGDAVFTLTRAFATTGRTAIEVQKAVEAASGFIEGVPTEERGRRAAIWAVLAALEHQRFDASAAEAALSMVDPAALDGVVASHYYLDVRGLVSLGRLEIASARASFEEATELARNAQEPWLLSTTHSHLAIALTTIGDLRRADIEADVTAETAESIGDWARHAACLACRSLGAAARGAIREAVDYGDVAWRSYRRSGFTFAALMAVPTLVYLHALAGSDDQSDEWLDRYREISGFTGAALHLLRAPFLNRDSPEIGIVALLKPSVSLPGLTHAAAFVEGASLLRADKLEEGLLAASHVLDAAARGGVRFGMEVPYFVPRLRALAAWLLGDHERAHSLVKEASLAAMSCGAEIELARCLVDRARFSERLGDRSNGNRFLEQASEMARGLDAPGLDRLIERTRAVVDGLDFDKDMFILFTDIVGSTRLNSSAGDEDWLRILRAHDERLEREIRRWRGLTFKHSGDGLHARFASAGDAVLCALRIQDDLVKDPIGINGEDLRIRVAVVSGSPIPDRGDLFGTSMSLAARLCDLVQPGGVLVTESVLLLIPGGQFNVGALESFRPRGLPDDVRYAAPRLRAISVSADTDGP